MLRAAVAQLALAKNGILEEFECAVTFLGREPDKNRGGSDLNRRGYPRSTAAVGSSFFIRDT